MKKGDLIFACIMMLLAVMLGAFGAHALKEQLSIESLESFNTGVRYQMIHAISIIIFSLPAFEAIKNRNWIIRLFKIGIILFSFSIYLLTVNKIIEFGSVAKYFGPITPIGGMSLISGWVLLIIGLGSIRK